MLESHRVGGRRDRARRGPVSRPLRSDGQRGLCDRGLILSLLSDHESVYADSVRRCSGHIYLSYKQTLLLTFMKRIRMRLSTAYVCTVLCDEVPLPTTKVVFARPNRVLSHIGDALASSIGGSPRSRSTQITMRGQYARVVSYRRINK